ncbi:hypothetical protein L4D77_22610 [Photobacterium frigidiphilum]|uniref:hypothetical protein n=1 Tax=Photobacterium frigidiphilum TaxID=264736 RepID=UPI003D0CAAE7
MSQSKQAELNSTIQKRRERRDAILAGIALFLLTAFLTLTDLDAMLVALIHDTHF